MGWSAPPSTGGSAAAPLTLASGTLVGSSNPALTVTQTWNNVATTFAASVVDVVNTASSPASYNVAGSLLADWRVSGTSVASMAATGMLTVRGGSYNNLSVQFGVGSGVGVWWNNGALNIADNGGGGKLACGTITSSGGLGLALAAKTTAYNVSTDDYVITGDATGGAFSTTLHTAVGNTGRIHVIKKIDASANAVTVATTSSQTIDGSTTYSLPARWNSVTVVSDGTNWLIAAKV